ncbi:hypothetical protein OV079_28690 [Nannocystis pusilla]|uniref:Uncharacterized protein n=1 Tax=Nannocystis pusilla TaxID=889268 RepID=A0A9X3ESQ6_9BACT|nr:hypothetical protein [Nannocystis pusilla]MCY1009472.1 hypothetical protein [Nannocystis pusilla]
MRTASSSPAAASRCVTAANSSARSTPSAPAHTRSRSPSGPATPSRADPTTCSCDPACTAAVARSNAAVTRSCVGDGQRPNGGKLPDRSFTSSCSSGQVRTVARIANGSSSRRLIRCTASTVNASGCQLARQPLIAAAISASLPVSLAIVRCGTKPGPRADCSSHRGNSAAAAACRADSAPGGSLTGSNHTVVLPRWSNRRTSLSAIRSGNSPRSAAVNAAAASANSASGTNPYTRLMCGIQRPWLGSWSTRIAWIAGHAAAGGITTSALRCTGLAAASRARRAAMSASATTCSSAHTPK